MEKKGNGSRLFGQYARDILVERYSRRVIAYARYCRLAAASYSALAFGVLCALAVMLLRVNGAIGNTACAVWLVVIGCALVADGIACRYFDARARKSLDDVIQYDSDLDKFEDRDGTEEPDDKCVICGRADVLLWCDPKGRAICDTCRSFWDDGKLP